MEEILELKDLLVKQEYESALNLVEEIEEMSRDDKINKIKGLMKILLLHLIKQEAEQRTTRSWDLSIENSMDQIKDTNKRRKTGGFYLTEAELSDIVEEAYPIALKMASLEAFEGEFSDQELAQKIDVNQIKEKALTLVLTEK